MAIEFLRMKLRRLSGTPVLLSGSAALQPDGTLDLFGDAAAHADAIADAVEAVDTAKPTAPLPHLLVLADDCAGCPLAARANQGRGCACVQVDRFRVGAEESLSPMLLRPGLPPAELRGAGDGRPPALWRDFALFRAARARGAARTLVTAVRAA